MTMYYSIASLLLICSIAIEAIVRDRGRKRKILSVVFFIAIYLTFALRHPTMGLDLGYGKQYGYLASFRYLSQLPFKKLIEMGNYLNYEIGYMLLNRIIGLITSNQQFFLAFCAFISILPVSYIIWKKSSDICFSYMIFAGLPVFLLLFSGLRQSIAIGICFVSIVFIQEKKLVYFIITVIAATLFHWSAIVFLIAYPLYHCELDLKKRFLSIVIFPLVFLFREPIFTFIGGLLKDNIQIDNNGSIKLFLLFVCIYIICVLFGKREGEQNGYLNLFYVACVCQIFANINNVALRMGYYFVIFLALLLPQVIFQMDKKRDATILKIIIGSFFLWFAFDNLASSSWAMSNPYIFFWNDCY